jgi:pectinesterase
MTIVILECGSAVAACSFFRRNLQQQSDNASPAAGQAQAAGQGMAPPSSTTDPAATGTGSGATIYVDIAGTGNFNSLQAAVNSIPAGNPERVTIVIKPGTYLYKIDFPNFIQFLAL